MIRDYNNIRLNKEVEISIGLHLEDIILTIKKMKSYDIHIINIQQFIARPSYFTSERANQKNFIYVSDEGFSENKNLETLVEFTIEAISIIEDKLKCNIIVGEEKKEIEFSKPPKNLIEKYRKARLNAINRNMKKQIPEYKGSE